MWNFSTGKCRRTFRHRHVVQTVHVSKMIIMTFCFLYFHLYCTVWYCLQVPCGRKSWRWRLAERGKTVKYGYSASCSSSSNKSNWSFQVKLSFALLSFFITFPFFVVSTYFQYGLKRLGNLTVNGFVVMFCAEIVHHTFLDFVGVGYACCQWMRRWKG